MPPSGNDHLGLLVDVSEFAARLAGSADIRSYLREIVGLVADHLGADVSSIYLHDERSGDLVLEATVGLTEQSVRQVRMSTDEGLAGLAFREMRSVCERRASRHPAFKAFAGIGEERFDAFMAVPIHRGVERIGVLVVQRHHRHPFTEQEVLAMRGISSQLAGAIENARMLMTLQEPAEPLEVAALTRLVKGQSASRGFAIGASFVEDHTRHHRLVAAATRARQYQRDEFERSLDRTAEDLAGLQGRLGQRLPEMASLIFDAHLMMLKDVTFVGEIRTRIEGGENPPEAIVAVGQKFMDLFGASPHAYMREKEQDVEDVVRRLLANLIGPGVEQHAAGTGRIVIARELYPSDVVKLTLADVQGIVLVSGGVTSHVSILARSLKVPLIIADQPDLLELPEGTRIGLDADIGNIYINPGPDVIERFDRRDAARREVALLPEAPREKTFTADRVRIGLLANINLLTDVELAHHVRAEGVGLYRSEFPFLVRNSVPSEAEQYAIYKRLVDDFAGREVTFRTLDIGGDKLLAYYDDTVEANPAMGLRSIRFSFRHEDLFESQLRAILRAGADANSMRIMFPMVSSLDDLRRARATLNKCIADLQAAGQPCHDHPAVGIMVEVPSAVEMADALAEEVDFFCIGTNDLIQFLLAVDRSNEKVAEYFVPHHPAVLRALARVAAAGVRCGREVSICGEMAHETAYLPFLLGIGIRALSVDPQYILKLQNAIEKLAIPEAQAQAQTLLAQTTLQGVDEHLGKCSNRSSVNGSQ